MSQKGARVGRQRQKVWLITAQCLMWLIWLESRLLFVLHRQVTISVDPDVLAFVEFVDNMTA